MSLALPSGSVPPGTCNNDQGMVAIIVEAVLIGLALVVVVFRLFSRIYDRKGLMANDYAMFLGMVGDSSFRVCFAY